MILPTINLYNDKIPFYDRENENSSTIPNKLFSEYLLSHLPPAWSSRHVHVYSPPTLLHVALLKHGLDSHGSVHMKKKKYAKCQQQKSLNEINNWLKQNVLWEHRHSRYNKMCRLTCATYISLQYFTLDYHVMKS